MRREIEATWGTSKEEFDASILHHAEFGWITLHHHDHPAGVDEATRRAMVADAHGNHYIGFVLMEE